MGKDYGTGTIITAQTAIHIYDGEKITAPVVSSAGVLNVHSGGTATNVVESGGQVIVENSATVTFAPTVFTNLTLSSASHLAAAIHTATIHSGTTANKTTLTAGYELHVFTGGVANSTTINYGCLLVVSNGGTANDNFVEPGGTLFISNGGVANRTSGGEVQVYKGGIANSTTADRYMYVRVDATANSTTVLDGSVVVDGHMFDTTISGGSMEICKDATASRTVVSGGSFIIASGGFASSATVNNGGSMLIYSAGAAQGVHLSGGRMLVSFGGRVSSAVVSAGKVYIDGYSFRATVSGGSMEIFSATGESSGGTANSTTVTNGGFFFVSPDAVASNTRIAETGSMIVSSDATADNTSMTGAGAWLSIQTGGTANNTTVSNGRMFVSGTANTGVVTVEGEMYVSDGGQANDVKVSNGGWMVVSTGGTANGAIVTNALLDVRSGVANGAVVRNDGTLDVMWNGAANDTTVSSGGNLIVFQGGNASNTLVKYGGSAIISGNAENTTVNQMGGEEFAGLTVCPGGRATSTTINSLGCMYISDGGQATSTTVNYGGILSVCYGGQATSSFIKDYGSMYVLDGGQASGARVSSGGYMHVSNGGKASNTFLYGGNMFASAGATVTNAMVQQGATLRAYAGAGATGIVEAGGYVDLQDGVTATFLANTFEDLTLANESATVHSMTKAQNITLNHFGSLTVYTGGIASGTTVNGGNLYVSTGGVATGVDVKNGGRLYLYDGGKATGKLTIADGATVSAYEGAVVDFDISALSPASEKLVNDLSRIKGNPGFTLTIDGAEAAGSYNLAGGAADFDGTITVVNTLGTELGTLTVGGAAYSDGDRHYKLRLTGSDLAVMVDVGDITPDLTGDLDTHYELTAGMFASNVNVNAGGRLDVLNGGTANNTTVNANGYLYIESGGVANNTTVNSGGSSIVSNGGTADNATVNDGGYLYVESSGTANNTTVNSKGELNVSAGGTANNTTVNYWGEMYVSAGGTADNTTVNSAGRLNVSAGGTANNTTVNGMLLVDSGGTANDVTIVNKGILHVDGTATNIVWTPCEGYVYVYEGASATFATKYSGVYFGSDGKLLESAAVMDGKVLDNNYEMYVMNVGTATNALVNDGGYLYVESSGTANNATVNDGGRFYVSSAGTAANTTLNSRGYLVVSSGGTAEDTTVNGGASFYINSGGTATQVRENGGYVNVDANADVTFASNTITGLVFSTVATIHSGTTATNATVKGGGSPVFVYGGGVVIDTTVLEGSLFLSGGVATDTAINSGGSFYVFSGGVADNTTVNSGGNFQLVNYDDIANNTTVNDGGYFIVTGHNTANGVVVSSGGSLYLAGGKLTGNAVFETGAIVDVSGATVDFDLTQTTPGTDPLVNDLSFVMSSSTTYTLTVNGTVVNGTYSLAGGATGFDTTITVNNTLGEGIGTLSVGDVEKEIAGMQFSLALNGSDLTVTVAGGSEPDTTAPTVSNIQASITTPTNQNVTVTADFDDDMALKSRLYRLEGDSDWNAYPEGGVVVTENTTVYFKAVDTSGNECKPKFITIDTIDKVAPTITGITPSTTAPATSVTVTAVFDDDVELSTTLYRIGDGGWFNYHLEGVTVTTNTTVYFKATDTAGNATTASYEVTNIETTTPDTTKPVVSDVKANITKPTNKNVTVTANFSDDVALKSSLYRINDGAWTDYTTGVTVTENATVYFKAVDTSSNESEVVSYAVTNIDKIPPAKPTASADVTEKTYDSVTVTAVFSGDTAKKEFSLDGLIWQIYTAPIVFNANGTVLFRGTDAAGNVSEINSYDVTNIEPYVPENGPEEPYNNTLLTDTKDVNEKIRKAYGTVLTAAGQEILLDKSGTVDYGEKHYHNHVGKSTSVLADDYKFDYAKIVLEHGAKLSFHAEATAAATFTVYRLSQNAKTKKYTLKKLQKLKLTDKDRDGVFTADSKKLLSLSVSGEYYVSMQYADKRKDVSEAYYNVTLNGGDKGSVFYPLGNNTDDWTDMKTAGWGGAIDDRGTVTSATDLVKGEWVGFGDKTDYKKITLDSAAELDFKFSVSDNHNPVKFTIGKLKETVKKSGTTYSLVTIKSATVAANKLSAELNALRLEKGEYYIKAESKNVKKDTGYDIQITDGNFYTDGDDGWNNVLLNGKKLNENEAYFYDNKLAGSGDVHLDKAGNDMSSDDYAAFSYGGNSYGGFVGFGDETDFAKLTVSQTSDVTFTFTATNDATLEIFKVTKSGEKYSKKSIQTVKYKAGSAPATSKKPVTLEVKDGVSYYVSVKATNIRKTTVDPQTYYNVSYAIESKEASALSMPETASVASALSMPETAPVASALEMPMAAAAYADSVQDKLFGETGNGLLASL